MNDAKGEISVELSVFGPDHLPVSQPFSFKVKKAENKDLNAAVAELVELCIGNQEICKEALIKFGGDKEAAIDWILNQNQSV